MAIRMLTSAYVWVVLVQSAGKPPGMAGLRNLGNTCFMASSVQCLMHTMPLVAPFRDNSYQQDLNKDNPLGLHGELAEAFAALAVKLWQAWPLLEILCACMCSIAFPLLHLIGEMLTGELASVT